MIVVVIVGSVYTHVCVCIITHIALFAGDVSWS